MRSMKLQKRPKNNVQAFVAGKSGRLEKQIKFYYKMWRVLFIRKY